MLTLLIVLCLVGFFMWLIPMDSRIKTIIIVVVAVVVAIVLYNMFGGGHISFPGMH